MTGSKINTPPVAKEEPRGKTVAKEEHEGEIQETLLKKYNLTILGDYKTYVNELFEANSEIIVSNGLPEHAATLVSTLFRRAKEEVVIFCHDLNSKIYAEVEVIKEIVDAVHRGVQVRIVTQVAPQAVELLCKLRLLSKCNPELVQLKRCPPESEGFRLGFNFAVMDSKAFRFEPNRDEIKADACANSPILAHRMVSFFNRLCLAAVPDNLTQEDDQVDACAASVIATA